MSLDPPAAWADLPFFEDAYPRLREKLESPSRSGWLPGPDRVFAALEAVSPEDARVVIIGQDPYPTPGHANGLAFSVNPGVPDPRSLANIRKELLADYGAAPPDGDLSGWARQGVLLLNTILSVMPGDPGSHAMIGWAGLVPEVVRCAQRAGPLAFVLWGAHAASAASGLPREGDLLLRSAHPSPLSAHRGFFGSRPFTAVNGWLIGQGRSPIDWAAPAVRIR